MRRSWTLAAMMASVLLVSAGCMPSGTTSQGPRRTPSVVTPPDPMAVWPARAVWVIRRGYDSPRDIARLMDQCANVGLNTVLFQVRGNGTVYYRSQYEPWARDYPNGDPGFDPLEVACKEAHRRGLALHAWVNVTPGWRGAQPPADPRQLYNAHPEWFLYDQNRQRQPLDPTFYVSLNPCLPEVREHLVGIMAEIVRNYPVDGLHLDYIRFPIEKAPKGIDYPRDPRTMELYKAATGKRPWDDRQLWTRWRTEQVTTLVRQIRIRTRQLRRSVRLTTACAPDIYQARSRYFQDGPTWLRLGLVDAVFVMNYTSNLARYEQRQQAWRSVAGGQAAAPGISIGIPDDKDPQTVVDELRLAQRWGSGFALFSAKAIFEDNQQAQRRLQVIGPALRAMARPRSTAEQSRGEPLACLGQPPRSPR